MTRFDPDEMHALSGDQLNKLGDVARALDDPASLSFDKRRDFANLINLILSEAIPL